MNLKRLDSQPLLPRTSAIQPGLEPVCLAKESDQFKTN
jgi:hypothetical protein